MRSSPTKNWNVVPDLPGGGRITARPRLKIFQAQLRTIPDLARKCGGLRLWPRRVRHAARRGCRARCDDFVLHSRAVAGRELLAGDPVGKVLDRGLIDRQDAVAECRQVIRHLASLRHGTDAVRRAAAFAQTR